MTWIVLGHRSCCTIKSESLYIPELCRTGQQMWGGNIDIQCWHMERLPWSPRSWGGSRRWWTTWPARRLSSTSSWWLIYVWKDNKNVTLYIVKCFLFLLPVEKCLVWWSLEGSIPVLYPSDNLPSFSSQAGKPGLFKFPDTNQPQTPGTNHAFDTYLSLSVFDFLLLLWKYIFIL